MGVTFLFILYGICPCGGKPRTVGVTFKLNLDGERHACCKARKLEYKVYAGAGDDGHDDGMQLTMMAAMAAK